MTLITWQEFDLMTGKHTGKELQFMPGINPDYYLNMKQGGGWIMSPHNTCMNKNKDTTWHIKKEVV